MGNMTFHRLLLLMCLGLPALVLLAAYITIAVHTGNPWPWLEGVHESGNRTLIDTVLYFEHASRELPLDIVLGIAVGGSARWALPRSGVASHHRSVLLSAAIVLIIGIIISGTLFTGGSASLWDNLLQMHTRPGEPLGFGNHWCFHFLSRLLLMLASLGMAGLVMKCTTSWDDFTNLCTSSKHMAPLELFSKRHFSTRTFSSLAC